MLRMFRVFGSLGGRFSGESQAWEWGVWTSLTIVSVCSDLGLRQRDFRRREDKEISLNTFPFPQLFFLTTHLILLFPFLWEFPSRAKQLCFPLIPKAHQALFCCSGLESNYAGQMEAWSSVCLSDGRPRSVPSTASGIFDVLWIFKHEQSLLKAWMMSPHLQKMTGCDPVSQGTNYVTGKGAPEALSISALSIRGLPSWGKLMPLYPPVLYILICIAWFSANNSY